MSDDAIGEAVDSVVNDDEPREEEPSQETLGDDFPPPLVETDLGFGGTSIKTPERVKIGDEVHLVIKLRITGDGRKEKDGGVRYKASGPTYILRHLTPGEAATLAGGDDLEEEEADGAEG